MKSFKILLTIVIGVATLGITNAQTQQRKQGPPPIPNEKQVEKMVGELKDQLQLDDEQFEKLTLLFKTHFSELKENKKKADKQREQQREKMEAARKEFENKIMEVLTEDQQKLFEKFKKQNRPLKGGRAKEHDTR